MDKIDIIAQYLNSCSTTVQYGCARGTGLNAIYRFVFKSKKNPIKADKVKELSEFYANEQNIINIWENLSEVEKDFITAIVQYNGKEHIPTTTKIAEKHNLKTVITLANGLTRNILTDYYNAEYLKFLFILQDNLPNTNAVLFFPNGRTMPMFILETLKKITKPFKYEYSEYLPKKNKKDLIITRENRSGDFLALTVFASSEKLKVKPDTFDLSKTKLAKMSEAIGFDEVCDLEGEFCEPKSAKRTNDFKVALPMFILAANSGLLTIDNLGNVSPNPKSADLLVLPPHKLMKKMFNDYIKSNKIYELHYITYVKTYEPESYIKWNLCREPIIELLKTCPVDKFINYEDFDKYACVFHENFFRKLLSSSVVLKGYDYGYGYYHDHHEPEWDECESHIIRLIFSFLSAIGMIDIAYTEDVPRILDDEYYCVGISGFRITKLGAWILGITKKYEPSEFDNVQNTNNNDGSLLVLPDYTVFISGLKHRIKYETYLSKYLTKVSLDENAAVYKIDFQSIIRAFNIYYKPHQIKAFLEKASDKPLPDNVIRSLDDWQSKVDRVKVRNVTIIETDDKLLLEEIKHIKGMEKIIYNDISYAVELNKDEVKKAKKMIEKNGWLVSE